MKKLSVILPTYNIKKYIHQTLDSVLNQTHTDLEVIIIDDNSTDETPTILKEFAKKDSRIKLILNNKNIGPGAARNIGIKTATGYYITFMDHDDWQDMDRYEKMIAQIEKDKTKACFSYASEYLENTCEYKEMPYPRYDTGAIDLTTERNNFLYIFFPPWVKIYKTSLVKNNDIKFAENGIKFDDVLFYSLLILSIDKISIYNKVSYFHRLFDDSLTTRFFDKKGFMNKEYIETLKQALECKTSIDKQDLISYYLKLIDFNLLDIKDIRFLFSKAPKSVTKKLLSLKNIRKLLIQIKFKKNKKIIRLFGIYLIKKGL